MQINCTNLASSAFEKMYMKYETSKSLYEKIQLDIGLKI